MKNEDISILYINTLSYLFNEYKNISSICMKELIPSLIQKSEYVNDKICVSIWKLIEVVLNNNKIVEKGYICVLMEGIIMIIMSKDNISDELKCEVKNVKNMLYEMNENWINEVIDRMCKENNKFKILL